MLFTAAYRETINYYYYFERKKIEEQNEIFCELENVAMYRIPLRRRWKKILEVTIARKRLDYNSINAS